MCPSHSAPSSVPESPPPPLADSGSFPRSCRRCGWRRRHSLRHRRAPHLRLCPPGRVPRAAPPLSRASRRSLLARYGTARQPPAAARRRRLGWPANREPHHPQRVRRRRGRRLPALPGLAPRDAPLLQLNPGPGRRIRGGLCAPARRACREGGGEGSETGHLAGLVQPRCGLERAGIPLSDVPSTRLCFTLGLAAAPGVMHNRQDMSGLWPPCEAAAPHPLHIELEPEEAFGHCNGFRLRFRVMIEIIQLVNGAMARRRGSNEGAYK